MCRLCPRTCVGVRKGGKAGRTSGWLVVLGSRCVVEKTVASFPLRSVDSPVCVHYSTSGKGKCAIVKQKEKHL